MRPRELSYELYQKVYPKLYQEGSSEYSYIFKYSGHAADYEYVTTSRIVNDLSRDNILPDRFNGICIINGVTPDRQSHHIT